MSGIPEDSDGVRDILVKRDYVALSLYRGTG